MCYCEFMNFPGSFSTTDKEIRIFLCVHEFPHEFFCNRQRKCEFSYGLDYFPVRFFKTDKKIPISLCVVEKTLKENGHTQGKDSFQ